MVAQVKEELTGQIKLLQSVKGMLSQSEKHPHWIEQSSRAKLRIQIETFLIQLNEEMFAISDNLARAYTNNEQGLTPEKAKEFVQRKSKIVKRVAEVLA